MLVLILAAGLSIAAPEGNGRDELRAAADEVQRESNGKILSARTVNYGRQRMHRIKVLTDEGRVQVRTVPERPGPRPSSGDAGRGQGGNRNSRSERPQ